MKKYTMTKIFGIIGIIFWAVTILLRESTVNTSEGVNFILGVMPNISAAWFLVWIGEVIISKSKYNFNFKVSSIISVAILLLAIISEVIHDIFLNSPFDTYDIIATVLAITLYLVVFYISNFHIKVKERV